MHDFRCFRMRLLLALLLLAMAGFAPFASADGDDGSDRHRVKGDIDFSYDYPATLAAAKENGKAIFAYFTFEK